VLSQTGLGSRPARPAGMRRLLPYMSLPCKRLLQTFFSTVWKARRKRGNLGLADPAKADNQGTMTKTDEKNKGGAGTSAKEAGKPSREDRLSAALRENLKKRKAAARSRKEQPSGTNAVAGRDGSGSDGSA